MPIFELRIAEANSRLFSAPIIFIGITILIAVLFVIFKMIIPSLSVRPFNWMALLIPAFVFTILFIVGYLLVAGSVYQKPRFVILYQDHIKFDKALKEVPVEFVSVNLGKLEGLNLNEGWASSVPLGEALVFKIDHFNDYFDPSVVQSLGPEFMETGRVKYPIGDTLKPRGKPHVLEKRNHRKMQAKSDSENFGYSDCDHLARLRSAWFNSRRLVDV